jgi:phage-related protein
LPHTEVFFFRDAKDGLVPLLDWLDGLPTRAQGKCVARIDRLAELGHEIRRPEADFLRDGIYELRASYQGVHYRILYFFAGRSAVVLSHGFTKEREVPPREIDTAVERRRRVEADFGRFTFRVE